MELCVCVCECLRNDMNLSEYSIRNIQYYCTVHCVYYTPYYYTIFILHIIVVCPCSVHTIQTEF